MSIAKSGKYWTFLEDGQVFHYREDKLLGVYDVNTHAVVEVVAGPHVVLRLKGGNIDLTTNTLGVAVDEVKTDRHYVVERDEEVTVKCFENGAQIFKVEVCEDAVQVTKAMVQAAADAAEEVARWKALAEERLQVLVNETISRKKAEEALQEAEKTRQESQAEYEAATWEGKSLLARNAALEAERDEARAELDEARARLRDLEKRQKSFLQAVEGLKRKRV